MGEDFLRLQASLPLAVSSGTREVGRRIKASKRLFFWEFCFGPTGRVHRLELTVSVLSGKRVVTLDGVETMNFATMRPDFLYTLAIGPHLARLENEGDGFILALDSLVFNELRNRRDVTSDEAQRLGAL